MQKLGKEWLEQQLRAYLIEATFGVVGVMACLQQFRAKMDS
jgi:hypothetical protein